jgi:hypothetical protein
MLLMWLTIFILNGLVFLVRKRLSSIEMYTTSLFSIYLALFADSVLGGMFKLYSYFEAGVEWIDFVGAIGIYPAVNILFLALFPTGKSWIRKGMYILGWTLFALSFEYVASRYSTFFQYSGWKLIYSVPVYPVLYGILLYNFRLVKKLRGNRDLIFHLTPLEWYGSIFFILYMNLSTDALLKGKYELYYYVVNDVHLVDFLYRWIGLGIPILIFLSKQAGHPSISSFILWIGILSIIQHIATLFTLFHPANWPHYKSILHFTVILLLPWINLLFLRYLMRGANKRDGP